MKRSRQTFFLKYFFVFVIALLLHTSNFLWAQQTPPSIKWQKCLGGSSIDEASDVTKTLDGGLLVVGHSESNDGDVSGNHGDADGWVVKLTATGNIEWQRSVGGTQEDRFYAAIALNDGGFLCLGRTTSGDGDMIGFHGDTDMFLTRLDKFGNIIWNKVYGGTKMEEPWNIKLSKDGSVFMVGSTQSNDGDVSGIHPSSTNSKHDAWVVKLNLDGNILWQHCFGGSGNDYGWDVAESSNGDYFLVLTNVSIDGDFGSAAEPGSRGIVAKIRGSDNAVIWRTANGTYDDYSQIMHSGNSTGSDSFFVAHDKVICLPPNLSYDTYLSFHSDDGIGIKDISSVPGFGSCGKLYYGGSAQNASFLSLSNFVYAVKTNDPGAPGFHISNPIYGYTDGFLMQFNSPQSIGWRKCYGGSGDDAFRSSEIINDYEFVAVGFTKSNDGDVTGHHNVGASDIWIVKFGRDSVNRVDTVISPGSIVNLIAEITGTAYQWQVDTGTGYVDIADNAVYLGASSANLRINTQTSYYGYKYRCLVTQPSGILYNVEYTLKFQTLWVGINSTDWHNTGNWSSGQIPDIYTDIVIPAGTTYSPEVTSNLSLRSLRVETGATVTVKSGAVLKIEF